MVHVTLCGNLGFNFHYIQLSDSMAGHSKFKNIMYRKGAQDAKRAKVFTKIIREITVAARGGMPDPAMNPALASASRFARSTGNSRTPAASSMSAATTLCGTAPICDNRSSRLGDAEARIKRALTAAPII